MKLRKKLRKKRQALKVMRKASKMLGVRSGVFMYKLKCRDADAQVAVAVAAEEIGDFDINSIAAIIEMILAFFELLSEIFGWGD